MDRKYKSIAQVENPACAVAFDLGILITFSPPALLKTQRSQRFFFICR
jgi:hypothetical protein